VHTDTYLARQDATFKLSSKSRVIRLCTSHLGTTPTCRNDKSSDNITCNIQKKS